MEEVDIVFVVLCYRNTDDLYDFLGSLDIIKSKHKTIIVNSFYDEETDSKFKEIADEAGCDFISIPNKGYSYGNNVGIAFAKERYKFNYLVVSNPDIVVNKWCFDKLDNTKTQNAIVVPKIITLSGKKQNPMIPYDNKVSEYFMYKYTQNRKWINFCINVGLNKILRGLYRFFHLASSRRLNKIYCPHGSFLVFSKHALDKINPVFDDNMFLFCEESVIAIRAKEAKIPIYYTSSLCVTHKEDGSMGFLKQQDINEFLIDSFVYYYKNYRTLN